MSGLWGHLVGVVILLLMAVFIGIWFWAWRPRHKGTFDELAALPMRDGQSALGESAQRDDGTEPPNRGES
jgi:cytochrome c oxidase cbb3-type subunit IV